MFNNKNNYFEGIKISNLKIKELLLSIDKFLKKKKKDRYFHIVNLNPEIFLRAKKNHFYKRVINSSDLVLIDGIGIKLLLSIAGFPSGERLAGTDFAEKLIDWANKNNKKIFFLGGKNQTAKLTSKFFLKKYPHLKISYSAGAKKISVEKPQENKKIIKKIEKFKPDFLFVAYGPPLQEMWLYKNKEKLKGIVCMGVGGSFNFWSKKI